MCIDQLTLYAVLYSIIIFTSCVVLLFSYWTLSIQIVLDLCYLRLATAYIYSGSYTVVVSYAIFMEEHCKAQGMNIIIILVECILHDATFLSQACPLPSIL